VSRFDLVDNIDETCCCYRLFGQVVVTGYLYGFGAWLMHLFMVQVGAWLMHLFMVQVDYKLRYKLMHGSGYWYKLFGYKLTDTCLQQYISQ
jgi:hypothetical protein